MQPTAVTPARIDPPAQPLSLLRLLRAVVRNPIESWPRAVYREHLHRSRMPGRDAVFIMYPALIRQVLVDEADSFEKGMMARRALEPVLGDAILIADGARWRWQRRAAAPLFRREQLLDFLPAMIAAAERTRERWLSYPTASEIDVAREMMRTTFDIVLATMLSGSSAGDTARLERAIDLVGHGAHHRRRASLGSLSGHAQGAARARLSQTARRRPDDRGRSQRSLSQRSIVAPDRSQRSADRPLHERDRRS
jgi:cytochrome P450